MAGSGEIHVSLCSLCWRFINSLVGHSCSLKALMTMMQVMMLRLRLGNGYEDEDGDQEVGSGTGSGSGSRSRSRKGHEKLNYKEKKKEGNFMKLIKFYDENL